MSTPPVPFDWKQVDETMANPMLLDLSLDIRRFIHEDEQQIHFLNMGNENSLTDPTQRLEMQLLRSDEWAARTYQVYCEVWRSQQKTLSPQFLRAVCQHGVRVVISARISAVIAELGREQARTNRYGIEWLKAVTASFSRDMELLFGKWQRAAEFEAKSLQYMLAAGPNDAGVDAVAKEIVHARTQVRYFEARIASTEARLTACESALSYAQLRSTDAFRTKRIEQIIDRHKTDRQQFQSRLAEWQKIANAALNRCTEFTRPSIGTPISQDEVQGIDPELQPAENEDGAPQIVTAKPVRAFVVGPESEINQARSHVRRFEAGIAAVDTQLAALQQALTAAIVSGNSTIKASDINKGIRKLHADRKELEIRRDDWQLSLQSALNRAAADGRPGLPSDQRAIDNHEPQKVLAANGQPSLPQAGPSVSQESATGRNVSYASGLKRTIALLFSIAPDASDLEICRRLDEDGAYDLPKRWTTGNNRLFELAYKDRQHKSKVEKTISKVRTGMRRQGLLK